MKKNQKSLAERAKKIKLLLMDVDGVLTDGTLYYLPGPDDKPLEMKGFNAQDGVALRWLRHEGIATGIISGRESNGVAARARMLGMTHIYQNHLIKLPVFERILKETGMAPENIAFVGDDLTDIPVMKRCGLAVAVANARPEVKRLAHMVTLSQGGDGAIREVCELILKAQGHWKKVLERFS